MTALNSYTTLFIEGAIPVSGDITLYEYGKEESNNEITLFLRGADYQKYQSLNLFLCNINENIGTIPLFIYSNEASAPLTQEIPLFIQCEPFILNNSIDLFLNNNGIYETITLYIKGAGFRKGWYVTNDNIPLFINRENEVSVIPLYLKAVEGQPNSYITLFTEGYIPSTSWMTNSYCVLYINGANIVEDNITLCIPNTHDINNEFLTLFISGW